VCLGFLAGFCRIVKKFRSFLRSAFGVFDFPDRVFPEFPLLFVLMPGEDGLILLPAC